ncbi:MAG: radical SAM protein [bacterium]
MRTRRIHLISPRTDAVVARPIYLNRALCAPLAGLVAVAALVPRDQYEVVLTDENVEPVDFALKADLVGISAVTSHVKRAYKLADAFRSRGVAVILGGVHPSFMPTEALQHADAVVVGEAEGVMERVLEDLKGGRLGGIYKAGELPSLAGIPIPRYDLLKPHRYLNRAVIQTSRGCPHGCSFCTEHLLNGLALRSRPIDEVLRDIRSAGERQIILSDPDLFCSRTRALTLMQALRGMGIRWQASVDSRSLLDEQLLDLAAESGCYMLAIGFEWIFREAAQNGHRPWRRLEAFPLLVEKVRSSGILVFGQFVFGFDHDRPSVFEDTVQLAIRAGVDVGSFSIRTPYPGSRIWFEMLNAGRITTYDWDRYDQRNLVFRPLGLTAEEIRDGHANALEQFYSLRSLLARFPGFGSGSRLDWTLYNLFFKKGTRRSASADHPPEPAEVQVPPHHAIPPVMPRMRGWERLILEEAPL